MRSLAFALVALALASCTPPEAKAADGRYVTQALGGIAMIPWEQAQGDFTQLAQPGALTFVELAGVHCGGCKKNMLTFKKLAHVRHDVAIRVVMFPPDVCDDRTTPECRQAQQWSRQIGGCYTPTVWAFAPDGKLIARDDTCKDSRPGAGFFHAFAARELKQSAS